MQVVSKPDLKWFRRHFPIVDKMMKDVEDTKRDEQRYRDKIGYVPGEIKY